MPSEIGLEALPRDLGVAGTAPRRAAAANAAQLPRDSAFGYVPEVDALRGIAITMVVMIHCGLLPFGWMGVWLFYVVSGFAVTTSILGSRARGMEGGTLLRHFWARRALRILPVYLLYLALNLVWLLAIGHTGPLRELPALLLFFDNLQMIFTVYTPDTEWAPFGHLWSLSIEQQFYLAFPFLCLAAGRRRPGLALALVLALAPLMRAAVAAWAAGLGWEAGRIAFAVYAFAPAQADAFAAGALIALFRREIAARPQLARMAMRLALAVAALHVTVFVGINLARQGAWSIEALRNVVSGIVYGDGREITVYMVPVTIAASLLMAILAGRPGVLRLCRLPGLQGVGRISYGAYLFHLPVLVLLQMSVPALGRPGPAKLLLFLGAMAATLSVAWISFTFFEQRFLRERRRYG